VADVALLASAGDEPRKQRTSGVTGVKATVGGDKGSERFERERWPLGTHRSRGVHMAKCTVHTNESRVSSTVGVGMVLDAYRDASRRSPAFEIGLDRFGEAPESFVEEPGLCVLADEVIVQRVVERTEQVRERVQ
jgi:hypothetical protein